jgi:hypothetical protein
MADVGAAWRSAAKVDALGADPAAEVAHRKELERRAGGNLSVEAVGRLLGINRQAVDKRRRAGVLLATRQGGDWAYPRAQFHENVTIPCLADVLGARGVRPMGRARVPGDRRRRSGRADALRRPPEGRRYA